MHPATPTTARKKHAAAALAVAGAGLAAAALWPTGAQAAATTQLPACVTGSITVHGTVPNVLQGIETASFPLTLTGPGGTTASTLSFSAGSTSQNVTVASLPLGAYTVHETTPAGWDPQADTAVTLAAPSCTTPTGFDNTVAPAKAIAQSATLPAGMETGWIFTLVGPGTSAGGEKVLTLGPGPVSFATKLREGLYTVAETTSTGWDQTGSSGCAFTVDYPADAARAFACRVSNARQAGSTPTPAPSTPPPATPAPTATPSPHGVVLGVTTTSGAVGVPNTGAGTDALIGVPLILAGTGLLAAGRRRSRRR
jgi:hypothetical protein